MINFTDFNSICRLCLKKHDEQFVELFPNIGTADESSVAKIVEMFCSVQVREDEILFRM